MSIYTADCHPALEGVGVNGTDAKADILAFITGGRTINRNHFLRGPGVIAKPIPEALTQPFITPRSAIMHSNAGPRKTPWWSLVAYWARTDVAGEAHAQVDMNGAFVQAMPFNRRADCNYKANSWLHNGKIFGAISFETQDNGAASLPYTPWTQAQFDAMVNALTCICVVYRVRCTQPTSPYDSGIGHHSLFREWSSFVGKTCPGSARIRQMDELRRQVTERVAAYYQHAGGTCP